MPAEKGKPEFGPGPGKPVQWLVVPRDPMKQNMIKTAQSAFGAAQAAGYSLSECDVQQVRE